MTLRAIAEQTAVPYRTVNAVVYALERQHRVRADDYDKARCEQCFTVILAAVRPRAERVRHPHPRVLLLESRKAEQARANETARHLPAWVPHPMRVPAFSGTRVVHHI